MLAPMIFSYGIGERERVRGAPKTNLLAAGSESRILQSDKTVYIHDFIYRKKVTFP